MTKVRGVTGGGIDGKNVVHSSNPKTEPVSRAVSVGAVSRIGSMVGEGTPAKSLYQKGPGYSPPQGPKPMVCGVGGGRTVYKSGSQSATPAPKTTIGSGRDLFK
jgi:hypothetical protein